MPEPLEVGLAERQIATFRAGRRRGQVTCRYTDEALDTFPGGIPLLSCSLPLSARPLDASAFCRGLLPEGQHRDAMARLAGVPSNDTFGLLTRFGADVAGALVVTPANEERPPASVEPYTDESLAEEVIGLAENPLALHDDSELSIAGLQDKLLLVALPEGGWGRPRHGYPSTHILKTDDPRYSGLVDTEAACLRLAKAVGLGDLDPRCMDIAGVRCLVVSRFDRRKTADGAVERIHQEDTCQALGIDVDANRGRAKYERFGGPRLQQVAELLDTWSNSPLEALDELVRFVTFTVVIGNADAHGKNVGLLHPDPGRISLAPVYDPIPTIVWPRLRSSAAMTIGGADSMHDISIDDIVREAVGWPHEERRTRATAVRACEELREAARAGIADHDEVTGLVDRRTGALLDGTATTP